MSTESPKKQNSTIDSNFLGIGIAIGVALGVAYNNIAVGLILGIAFGIISGTYANKRGGDNSKRNDGSESK